MGASTLDDVVRSERYCASMRRGSGHALGARLLALALWLAPALAFMLWARGDGWIRGAAPNSLRIDTYAWALSLPPTGDVHVCVGRPDVSTEAARAAHCEYVIPLPDPALDPLQCRLDRVGGQWSVTQLGATVITGVRAGAQALTTVARGPVGDRLVAETTVSDGRWRALRSGSIAAATSAPADSQGAQVPMRVEVDPLPAQDTWRVTLIVGGDEVPLTLHPERAPEGLLLSDRMSLIWRRAEASRWPRLSRMREWLPFAETHARELHALPRNASWCVAHDCPAGSLALPGDRGRAVELAFGASDFPPSRRYRVFLPAEGGDLVIVRARCDPPSGVDAWWADARRLPSAGRLHLEKFHRTQRLRLDEAGRRIVRLPLLRGFDDPAPAALQVAFSARGGGLRIDATSEVDFERLDPRCALGGLLRAERCSQWHPGTAGQDAPPVAILARASGPRGPAAASRLVLVWRADHTNLLRRIGAAARVVLSCGVLWLLVFLSCTDPRASRSRRIIRWLWLVQSTLFAALVLVGIRLQARLLTGDDLLLRADRLDQQFFYAAFLLPAAALGFVAAREFDDARGPSPRASGGLVVRALRVVTATAAAFGVSAVTFSLVHALDGHRAVAGPWGDAPSPPWYIRDAASPDQPLRHSLLWLILGLASLLLAAILHRLPPRPPSDALEAGGASGGAPPPGAVEHDGKHAPQVQTPASETPPSPLRRRWLFVGAGSLALWFFKPDLLPLKVAEFVPAVVSLWCGYQFEKVAPFKQEVGASARRRSPWNLGFLGGLGLASLGTVWFYFHPPVLPFAVVLLPLALLGSMIALDRHPEWDAPLALVVCVGSLTYLRLGDLGPAMVFIGAMGVLLLLPRMANKLRGRSVAAVSLGVLALLCTALATRPMAEMLQSLLETAARLFHAGTLARGVQRAACFNSPSAHPVCQQWMESIWLAGRAALPPEQSPPLRWVANMHSDLAFASVGALWGRGAMDATLGAGAVVATILVVIAGLARRPGPSPLPRVPPAAVATAIALAAFWTFAWTVHVSSCLLLFLPTGVALPLVSQSGTSMVAWAVAFGACAAVTGYAVREGSP